MPQNVYYVAFNKPILDWVVGFANTFSRALKSLNPHTTPRDCASRLSCRQKHKAVERNKHVTIYAPQVSILQNFFIRPVWVTFSLPEGVTEILDDLSIELIRIHIRGIGEFK